MALVSPDPSRETAVPPIPEPRPDNLLDVVRALVEIISLREGLTGDPLDQNPTYRELYQRGKLDKSFLNGSAMVRLPGMDGLVFLTLPDKSAAPDYAPPPAPTGLIVTPGMATFILQIDKPSYPSHADTEVWRSGTNNLGTAVRIGTMQGGILYGDKLGLTGATRYFWVRHVNQAGVVGPYNATNGVGATTGLVGSADITDAAVTIQKMKMRRVALSGDAWTDNSPIAGKVAWNPHTLVFDGATNNIAAGNAANKWIYWDAASPGTYNSSALFPSLTDTQFLIAVNNGGAHDLVWNAEGIATKVIDTALIADAAIGTAQIQNAAVTNAIIANLAVDTAKLADAAVVTAKIGDASITTAKIVDANVTTAKIAAANITTALIANAAITTALIADANVVTAKIADANITTAKIADANVTTAKIANLAVTTALIADANVTTAKIANLAVTTALINDLAVTTGKINDVAITTAKIADAAITNAKIGTAAVQTANIADANITSAKINDLAVVSAKIGDAEVGTLKIAGNAVSSTVAAYTAADVSTSSGVATMQSATITTAGGTVLIAFSAHVRTASVQIAIKRGGTTIATIPAAAAVYISGGTMASGSITDAPAAGTYTYTFECVAVNAGTATFSSRSLVLTELKR
jgi:uncharacterized protein YjbI with pentapeptide repeats